MSRIIHLLGTDGAGKTTVARRLAADLRSSGHRSSYLYCQHRPLLLWLFKLPARLLFMRRTDQFKNHDEYKSRKDAVAGKRLGLTKLYSLLSYFDVWLQTWPRLAVARFRSDLIVVDRFYLDWVVNVGVLQNNSIEAMLGDARRLERVLPRAGLHVFLDVEEEVAFARKTDIQSVRYLRDRKARYLQLAPWFRFQCVDANQPEDVVFDAVKALVEAALASGHPFDEQVTQHG